MNYLKKSHAQAGQDALVAALLAGKRNGLFVEIGSSHPVELSNTYALESELGWRGIGIDSSPDSIALCQAQRSKDSRFICADARTFDWKAELNGFPHIIDFASVDVDSHTHEALKRLLESGYGFRVITCEHDRYQRSDSLRLPNRALLAEAGYDLLCSDVHSNGCCFEDFLVAGAPYVNMEIAARFRCDGKDWREVLLQGGVTL